MRLGRMEASRLTACQAARGNQGSQGVLPSRTAQAAEELRKEKELEERKRQADYDRLPPILKGLTVIARALLSNPNPPVVSPKPALSIAVRRKPRALRQRAC